MKTKILSFFFVLFGSMSVSLLSSCSSSDDGNSSETIITDAQIIGTWKVIDGYETNGEKTVTSSIGKLVKFNSDGTGEIGIASIKWSRSGNNFKYGYGSNTDTFSGTFSLSNGVLTMKGSGNGWNFEYKLQKQY